MILKEYGEVDGYGHGSLRLLMHRRRANVAFTPHVTPTRLTCVREIFISVEHTVLSRSFGAGGGRMYRRTDRACIT